MRRFWNILTICFFCGILVSSPFDTTAQNRRGHGHENSSHNNNNGGRGSNRRGSERRNHDNRQRPGNSNKNHQRPDNNKHQRPGNDNHQRPGKPGNNYRPGNSNGHHNKPGNNFRPGNNHRPDHTPNYRPGHNNHKPKPAPVYRPGHNNFNKHHGHGHRPTLPPPPPYRPYRYAPRAWHRPVPPPHFRPHYHVSPLQAILGFTFGTALNVSLNLLNSGNYSIDGYGDNRVYLRDVSAMNCYWPDATLYYNNGMLQSSTFSYSTSYFDNGRYNNVYNVLVNTYGMPVSTRHSGNMMSATWWGYNNQYVTLEFQPLYSPGGSLRYYTTLVMGN